MGFGAAGLLLLAGALWGLRLIFDPEPLADGAGALVAITMIVAAAVAALGLVLSRGRWARRFGLAVVAAQLALGVALEATVFGWVALAATAGALVLLGGPWLDSFLRQLPPADPPPAAAVALALGLVAVPGFLGLSAPGGVAWTHWAAALGALLTGWAFSRALPVGLWSGRLLVPVLVLGAGLQSPPAGLVGLALLALAIGALAWSPAATRAVHPLVPRAEGVAIPPQLVPSDLLARAGYDERGRPLPPQE